MRRYPIASEKIFAGFIAASGAMVLRDLSEQETPIQISYLNTVVGLFLRTLVKAYSPEDLSDEDRANLRRYLEKIFDAKDALLGKEPKR